jgi:BirA family biotin operon repressor/biotin-[acetyl-CoA-carboxylase] ligase
VREVRVLASASSTNDIVKEAARHGAPEGLVVLARTQTGGRGRHGRTWVSPPGNLFLSLLLRPRDAGCLSLLPLAAGVAVAEAMDAQGVPCQLKWPNDVLAGGRKIAGILAEASSDAGRVDSVVIGIGANVALRHAELPAELAAVTTSLVEETGRAHDVDAVAAAVLGRWALWYDALQVDARVVREAWRARSIDWWGRAVEVVSGERRLVGVARDIDESGALVLDTPDGATLKVVSGEARALRPADPS